MEISSSSSSMTFSTGEVEYILNHSGATFFFCDTELADIIRPAYDKLETVKHTINIVDADGFESLPGTDYESFLEQGSPEPVEKVIENEDEEISINYTSGTTGRPKGVVFCHRGAYLNSINEAMETGIRTKRPLCTAIRATPIVSSASG